MTNNYGIFKTTSLPQTGSLENKCLYRRWKNEGRLGVVQNFHICPAHPQLRLKNPFSVVECYYNFTSRLRSTTFFIEEFLLVSRSNTVG
jgi:hypothetical protein